MGPLAPSPHGRGQGVRGPAGPGKKPLTGFAQKVTSAQKRGILHKKPGDSFIGNAHIKMGISYKLVMGLEEVVIVVVVAP